MPQVMEAATFFTQHGQLPLTPKTIVANAAQFHDRLVLKPASRKPVNQISCEVFNVARPELGTKRVCPETERKFYDLNRDPIVSPYTGKSYPLSFFDDTKSEVIETKAEETETEAAEDEKEEENDDTLVSLEEADESSDDDSDANMPDLGDNTDDEVLENDDDEDDNTFLADDEDEGDDDVSGIISVGGSDDDDS